MSAEMIFLAERNVNALIKTLKELDGKLNIPSDPDMVHMFEASSGDILKHLTELRDLLAKIKPHVLYSWE